MLIHLVLAFIAGAICGGTLAFEYYTPPEQRNSWRHWLLLVVAAVLVMSGAIVLKSMENSVEYGLAFKFAGFLSFGIGSALSFWLVGRKRSAPNK